MSPVVSMFRICSGSPSLFRTMLLSIALIWNAVAFDGIWVFCSTASCNWAPPCAVRRPSARTSFIQSSSAGSVIGEVRMKARRLWSPNVTVKCGAGSLGAKTLPPPCMTRLRNFSICPASTECVSSIVARTRCTPGSFASSDSVTSFKSARNGGVLASYSSLSIRTCAGNSSGSPIVPSNPVPCRPIPTPPRLTGRSDVVL